jgi:hypothetical protein
MRYEYGQVVNKLVFYSANAASQCSVSLLKVFEFEHT